MAIEKELGQKAARWNDDPSRTQEEVLAVAAVAYLLYVILAAAALHQR